MSDYPRVWSRIDAGKRAVAAILASDPEAQHVCAIVANMDGGNWLAPMRPMGSIVYLCNAMTLCGKPSDPHARAPLHVWSYHRKLLRCAECIAIVEDESMFAVYQHMWSD